MVLLNLYFEAFVVSLLMILSGTGAKIHTFNFETDLEGWSSYRNSWHWSNRGGLANPVPAHSGAGFAVMDDIYDSDELYTTYFSALQGGVFNMTFFVRSKWESSNTLQVDIWKNRSYDSRLLDLSYLSAPYNDNWITVSKDFDRSDDDIMFVIFCFNGDFATPPGEYMYGCAIDEIVVEVHGTEN